MKGTIPSPHWYDACRNFYLALLTFYLHRNTVENRGPFRVSNGRPTPDPSTARYTNDE